jgi:hypothetical protein
LAELAKKKKKMLYEDKKWEEMASLSEIFICKK